jgi:hypothetical protein
MATINNIINFEQRVLKTLGNPTSEVILFYQRKEVKTAMLKPTEIGFDYALQPKLNFYIYTN